MALSFAGNGTITGLSVGGLPDGCIASADIASGVIPAGGKILQVMTAQLTTPFTATGAGTWHDVTGLSVSITPSATDSRIFLTGNVSGFGGSSQYGGMKILRDSTAIGVGTGTLGSRVAGHKNMWAATTYHTTPMGISWVDSPATTSSLVYKVQIYSGSGSTVYVNRTGADGNGADTVRTVSDITAMEISA